MGKLLSALKRNQRLKSIIILSLKALFKIASLFPVKKDRVIFESFLGKQYSDNPRAIYEYLVKNNPDLELYWSIDKKYHSTFNGKNLKLINRLSFKWIFYMATSKYWVSNSRLPLWIPKPKHTVYIQTWHGTPLKKLGTDIQQVHMANTNTEEYKEEFIKEAAKWDYLVSPNNYSTNIFKRAFGFQKVFIESGYPRNDYLIHENNSNTITEIKKRNSIPDDKKVILYAPTWRDNQYHDVGKYRFNLKIDLNLLKDALGEEYVILLRMHYLVADSIDLTGYDGFVLNYSKYEDIRELYLISDLLITDYSSVFFDYAILKRPMIFFVYDIEEYRHNLRGFYFNFENEAPGPLVRTTEEVIYAIKNLDSNNFIESDQFQAFYKKFCYLEDGNASRRVVEEVFLHKSDK